MLYSSIAAFIARIAAESVKKLNEYFITTWSYYVNVPRRNYLNILSREYGLAFGKDFILILLNDVQLV